MWVLGAIQAGLGIYQLIRGSIEQNKLNNMKQPTYGLTSSMKSAKAQAEQMAQMGYTPQERAAFEQRLATSGNTAFRRATDMSGGNMAQALQGALNAQNIAAQNQFAAQDAALRRQNIAARNQLYGTEQNLENQNVAMQNQLMMARAQSLGAQRQSGMSNLVGALGGLVGGMGSPKSDTGTSGVTEATAGADLANNTAKSGIDSNIPTNISSLWGKNDLNSKLLPQNTTPAYPNIDFWKSYNSMLNRKPYGAIDFRFYNPIQID